MTQLQAAMASLMNIFDTYASIEGKKDTLTKAEVKILLEKELPDVLEEAKTQEDRDKYLNELDENGDSEVDFQEFVSAVAAISTICYNSCWKEFAG